jgi:hypothetical protein
MPRSRKVAVLLFATVVLFFLLTLLNTFGWFNPSTLRANSIERTNVIASLSAENERLQRRVQELEIAQESVKDVTSNMITTAFLENSPSDRSVLCHDLVLDPERAQQAVAATLKFLQNADIEKLQEIYGTIQNSSLFEVLGEVQTPCHVVESFSTGDEEKRFCMSDKMLQAPCDVFSIGGNNLWGFEVAIAKRTPCRIHTFDCTLADRGIKFK